MSLQSQRAQRSWRGFKIFRIFWLVVITGITASNIYDLWSRAKPFDWMNVWTFLGFIAFMGVFSVFYYGILKFVDGIVSDKEKNL